MSMKARVRRCT